MSTSAPGPSEHAGAPETARGGRLPDFLPAWLLVGGALPFWQRAPAWLVVAGCAAAGQWWLVG